MGRENLVREQVKDISLGIFNTVVDISLFLFAFGVQSYSLSRGKRDIFQAINESGKFVDFVRGKSFQRARYKGVQKKWLMKDKREWKITDSGSKRLTQILPNYKLNRSWDGKIYLITYDIPEKRKRQRDLLRDFLKSVGCGLLQASVWLTPNDPKRILSQFIIEYDLSGLVIISDVGKDGNIGQTSFKQLIESVYKMDQLNQRYAQFLEKMRERNGMSSFELSILYLSILKDDPQLPLVLLSDNWLGEKAYKSYLSLQVAAGEVR